MARNKGIRPSPQMQAIAAQAEQVRARLIAAQQAAASQEVAGSSADGTVQIVVTGDMSVRSVQIDPAAAADVAALEVSVAEALRDAVRAVNALRSGSTGGVDLQELNLGGIQIGS